MEKINKDPFGQAVWDYYTHKKAGKLMVLSDDFDDDEIPVAYLFRSFKEMPELEQKALNLCRGKILDIGAGAGCHAIWLQKNGKNVTALEQSELCTEVMLKSGIQQVIHQNLYELLPQKFDTLLLLMNGTGIAGKLENFPLFLSKLKELLSPGGQVLIDSSDLIYLYEDEDGSHNIPLNQKYYGELEYKIQYKNILGDTFPWLFVGKDVFQLHSENAGYTFEVMYEGENYDYLARLTLNTF